MGKVIQSVNNYVKSFVDKHDIYNPVKEFDLMANPELDKIDRDLRKCMTFMNYGTLQDELAKIVENGPVLTYFKEDYLKGPFAIGNARDFVEDTVRPEGYMLPDISRIVYGPEAVLKSGEYNPVIAHA